MASLIDGLQGYLNSVELALRKIRTGTSKQITQADSIAYLRSLAFAWYKSHRPTLAGGLPATSFLPVDEQVQTILDGTTRASARTTYVAALRSLKQELVSLRSVALTAPSVLGASAEPAPNFSPLASDQAMQAILVRRWEECQKCLNADANLAATVMMGGFLEALFVARANQLRDKGPLFRAKAAPRNPKTGKPIPLSEWTLRAYLDVGRELHWITSPAKSVADVLRDYRNYVHPEKERSHAVVLNSRDARMFWQIARALSDQLLASVGGAQ